MLQSKQNDQFDTPRLTHVVVVVSGFRCECFLSNTLLPHSEKSGKRLKMKRKLSTACKKAKVNVSMFLINKRSVKCQGKVRKFLTF